MAQVQIKDIFTRFNADNQTELVVIAKSGQIPTIKKLVAQAKQTAQKGKPLDLVISPHRDKRSVDANAYFHILVGKIAKVLNLSETEIKKQMVFDYGEPLKTEKGDTAYLRLPKSINVEMFCTYAKFFKTENDTNFYLLYKPTHTLNSTEMCRLIQGTIQEAKALEIDTMTPNEIKNLLSLEEKRK